MSFAPCPFCAGNATLQARRTGGTCNEPTMRFQMVCNRCRARGPLKADKWEATAAWSDMKVNRA